MIPAISFGSIYKINQNTKKAEQTCTYIKENLSRFQFGHVALNRPISLFEEPSAEDEVKFVSFGEDENYILTCEDAQKVQQLREEMEEDWERYHQYYQSDDLCQIMCEEAAERRDLRLKQHIAKSVQKYELDVSYKESDANRPRFTIVG